MANKKTYGVIGISDEYRSKKRIETYKFERDEAIRVAFPSLDIASAISHWVPGLGYVYCMGDPELVDETRHDSSCPMCAANLDSSLVDADGKPLVGKATRRFVMNFLKYFTRGSSIEPAKPVSVSTEVLRFTSRFYNRLLDMAEKGVDLQRTDFRIRCEEEKFQVLVLDDYGPAIWLQDPSIRERILEQFKEDAYPPDALLSILGRELSEDEVVSAIDRMRVTKNPEGHGLTGLSNEGVSGLLDAIEPKSKSPSTGNFDLSSLFD